MKHQFTFAILLFAMLTSAFAVEDGQPAANPSDTATATSDGANQITPQKKPLHFILGGGFTMGGDTLGTMIYSDGSTDSITAGGGLIIYAGLDYRLDESISLQSTLGYHFDSTKAASNGDVTFSRIPLDLLVYYQISDAFRFGGGFQLVNSPKIKGSGFASAANASFNNTVGLVIEGEYMVAPTFGVKVRYVSEKYKQSGWSGSIDGSHLGVLANLYL